MTAEGSFSDQLGLPTSATRSDVQRAVEAEELLDR